MTFVVPVRGRVYMADLGHGRKPFVVVSNNGRNERMPTCLGVRITTSTKKPRVATIVELAPQDPLVGRVLCDDIEILHRDELVQDLGGLTYDTRMRIGTALSIALAL
jgi:mRNA interferase MazF